MQRIATKIFIYASLAFGLIGISLVLTMPTESGPDPAHTVVLIRLLFITAFVILPSFALSVAGKYLRNGSSGS